MNEEEFRETKAAIDEALEQGERGEGRPAEEVFVDLRARYGISSWVPPKADTNYETPSRRHVMLRKRKVRTGK